ncbi:MAG: hypothetical protein ACXABY_12410, partial [Candidatus Thorarchaeota archaeon]
MITLIKIIISKLKVFMAKASRAYVKTKYGPRSDVCIVAGYPGGMIGFYTSYTSKIIPAEQVDNIRHTVGENVLHTFGIPM